MRSSFSPTDFRKQSWCVKSLQWMLHDDSEAIATTKPRNLAVFEVTLASQFRILTVSFEHTPRPLSSINHGYSGKVNRSRDVTRPVASAVRYIAIWWSHTSTERSTERKTRRAEPLPGHIESKQRNGGVRSKPTWQAPYSCCAVHSSVG